MLLNVGSLEAHERSSWLRLGKPEKSWNFRVLATAVILSLHLDELQELNKLADPWVKDAVLISFYFSTQRSHIVLFIDKKVPSYSRCFPAWAHHKVSRGVNCSWGFLYLKLENSLHGRVMGPGVHQWLFIQCISGPELDLLPCWCASLWSRKWLSSWDWNTWK